MVHVARVVDRFGSICSNLTLNLLAKTSKQFFFGTLSKLADLHDYKLYSDQRRFLHICKKYTVAVTVQKGSLKVL